MSVPLSDNPADLVRTVLRLVREIRQLKRDGAYKDSQEAKRLNAYDPLVELAIIANEDKTPVVARVFWHAKIADFLYLGGLSSAASPAIAP